jgi:hypothetical protein
MFKSASSWSSVFQHNMHSTRALSSLSSLSSAGGLVLVGTGASKDLSGRVCGGSNSMCCTLARLRFVDRLRRYHEAWQFPKVLDDFLSLTDYPAFVKRMYREIQQKREQDRSEPDFCRQEAELRRLGLNESCAVSTISESGHIEKCVGKT